MLLIYRLCILLRLAADLVVGWDMLSNESSSPICVLSSAAIAAVDVIAPVAVEQFFRC